MRNSAELSIAISRFWQKKLTAPTRFVWLRCSAFICLGMLWKSDFKRCYTYYANMYAAEWAERETALQSILVGFPTFWKGCWIVDRILSQQILSRHIGIWRITKSLYRLRWKLFRTTGRLYFWWKTVFITKSKSISVSDRFQKYIGEWSNTMRWSA